MTEMPAALAREALEEARPSRGRANGFEPALTALFAAAAVVFASSLAVVIGLV